MLRPYPTELHPTVNHVLPLYDVKRWVLVGFHPYGNDGEELLKKPPRRATLLVRRPV